jgi:peptidoglycan/xylan/chitin deacetylase (PgdA/CDA1 family)
MRAAAALFLLLGACVRTPEVPIFLFHSVGEESGDPRDVSNEEFEEELTLLEQFHATPVTLQQLFDAREKGTPLPKRAVVLTFDDGRAGLFAHAYPALQKHHAVAELFVVTDWVSNSAESRKRFKDETGEFPVMTWSELAELAQSGVMKIESHSVTHARMAGLDSKHQLEELTRSREVLRERLKVPCDFFAYPAGSLAGDTKDLAKQAGYRGALAVEAHGGGPYGLTRISVWRASVPVVRKALVGAFGEPK